jgi:hypothetical protein
MVCDSMVYQINNTTPVKYHFKAFDSTTHYTIRCELDGLTMTSITDANQAVDTIQTRIRNAVISPCIVNDTGRTYWAFATYAPNGLEGSKRYIHRWRSNYPCTAYTYVDSIMPWSGHIYLQDKPTDSATINHMDIVPLSASEWIGVFSLATLANPVELGDDGGEVWFFTTNDRGATWHSPRFVLSRSSDTSKWDSKYIYKADVSAVRDRGRFKDFVLTYSAKKRSTGHWHTGRTIVTLDTAYIDSVNIADSAIALHDINWEPGLDSTRIKDSSLSLDDINWQGGLDSTRLTNDGVGNEDINWPYEWHELNIVYGANAAKSDSITLTFPIRDGNQHWLFVNYTNTISGFPDDTVDVGGVIPYDFDFDSLRFYFRDSGISQIDSVWLLGPNRDSIVYDSTWWSDSTNQESNAGTWVTYYLDSAHTANKGDWFYLRFFNAFDSSDDTILVKTVQIGGRRR